MISSITWMLSPELSEEEVASIVIAAEGVLGEMSNLEQLSDEEGFQASVDTLLEGEHHQCAASLLSCEFVQCRGYFVGDSSLQ